MKYEEHECTQNFESVLMRCKQCKHYFTMGENGGEEMCFLLDLTDEEVQEFMSEDGE